MKDETKIWLNYANENFKSSKILLDSFLFNPSLQNAQQSIEKYLKAYCIEKGLKLQKTHNIISLVQTLKKENISINILDDEIDLADSIYLTSRYPLGSSFADFEPDEKICLECIDIAFRVKQDIEKYLI